MPEQTDRLTILLVDDDESALEMIRVFLEGHHCRVRTVNSGREALTVIDREAHLATRWRPWTIDLILLDIMMPGIDGFKVCHRIKDDPALCHIPVIMVTALDSSQDKVMAISFGADGYVTKPYLSEELIGTIQASMRTKAQQEALLRRLAELEALNAIVESAHQSLSLSLLLANTLTKLLEFQHVEAAAIYTVDETAGSLTLARSQGPEGVTLPLVNSCTLGQGISGWIGKTQQGRHIEDITSHPEFANRLHSSMHAYVGVALRADKRTVGVLEGFHRQPSWFDQRDVEWLEELGRHVGLAIDNAKIFERTQTLLIQSSSLRR